MNTDINLNQILNLLNIRISKETSTEITALCPFHSEKSPSWNISKNTFVWHCFGCGKSGNLYNLIKQKTGKSLYEFLNIKDSSSFQFAQQLNQSKTNVEIAKVRKRIVIREGTLKDPTTNPQVIEYLRGRGITEEFIQYFEMSYSEFARINTTRMYNRIFIPVFYKNRLINIEARDFTRRSKKKVLYPAGGISDTLFNYDRLDFTKPVYCTEGIFDLPGLFNLGERNLTCIFGVALGKLQSKLLSEIPHLVYLPDNDDSGTEMLKKLDEIMNHEWEIAFVPAHREDPGKCTKEEIKQAITNKVVALDYFKEQSFGKEQVLEW